MGLWCSVVLCCHGAQAGSHRQLSPLGLWAASSLLSLFLSVFWVAFRRAGFVWEVRDLGAQPWLCANAWPGGSNLGAAGCSSHAGPDPLLTWNPNHSGRVKECECLRWPSTGPETGNLGTQLASGARLGVGGGGRQRSTLDSAVLQGCQRGSQMLPGSHTSRARRQQPDRTSL